jgi:LysM repeat protein
MGLHRKDAAQVNTKATTLAVFIVAWLLVAPSVSHASAVYQQATIIHTVRAGDTLSSIGARYEISYQAIMRANNLTDTLIFPGQRLAIPVRGGTASAAAAPAGSSGGSYIVRSGDSLWAIANRYNVTVDALKQANGLVSTVIIAGQTLRIPPPGMFVRTVSSQTAEPTRTRCGPTYAVRRGDTLSAVASRCDTTVAALKFLNDLKGDGIRVGQVLSIPGGVASIPVSSHTTWLPSIVTNVSPAASGQ